MTARATLMVGILLACAAAAEEPRKAGEAETALAAGPATGFDFAGLGRLFDAARVRPAQTPEPPRTQSGEKAAPEPHIRARAAPWGRPLLIVPDPIATAAYRHTFNVLLANPQVTDQYDELILKYSSAYHVDSRLLKAIIAAESEFFIAAVSPRGARGLMQLMPATAEEFGIPRGTLSIPEYNIAAGAAYIANLLAAARRRFKLKGVDFQDAPLWLQERIIAAYNAGPRFLTSSRFLPQTRAYVRKVLLFYHSKVTDLRRPSEQSKPKVPIALTPGTLY